VILLILPLTAIPLISNNDGDGDDDDNDELAMSVLY